jgi:cob(I)alamin adenosyltransferase
MVPGEWLVPYLNRLADLLWVLARAEEQQEDRSATTVRTAPRPARKER